MQSRCASAAYQELTGAQVVHEIMQELRVGQYTIKLNHRLLLDAMMRVCTSTIQRATQE